MSRSSTWSWFRRSWHHRRRQSTCTWRHPAGWGSSPCSHQEAWCRTHRGWSWCKTAKNTIFVSLMGKFEFIPYTEEIKDKFKERLRLIGLSVRLRLRSSSWLCNSLPADLTLSQQTQYTKPTDKLLITKDFITAIKWQSSVMCSYTCSRPVCDLWLHPEATWSLYCRQNDGTQKNATQPWQPFLIWQHFLHFTWCRMWQKDLNNIAIPFLLPWFILNLETQ